MSIYPSDSGVQSLSRSVRDLRQCLIAVAPCGGAALVVMSTGMRASSVRNRPVRPS